jgi:hypothetical protein
MTKSLNSGMWYAIFIESLANSIMAGSFYSQIILFTAMGFGCWTSSNVPLIHGLGTGLANLELNSSG